MPNYNNIINKYKKKERKKRIYISSNPLNELIFLSRKLNKYSEKLTKDDIELLDLLKILKEHEIIEKFDWGINSFNRLEVYIKPIMEGMKAKILYDCLRGERRGQYVKREFF